MVNLYSTWAGLFRYNNSKMPLIHSTVTFQETATDKFRGFVSETPLIIPDDFKLSIDVRPNKGLTPWGSISCEIIEGELLEKYIPKWGRAINFAKTFEQLSGNPICCRGAFNSARGQIVGVWGLVEGDRPSNLPLNMKSGHFTFENHDSSRRSKFFIPLAYELQVA